MVWLKEIDIIIINKIKKVCKQMKLLNLDEFSIEKYDCNTLEYYISHGNDGIVFLVDNIIVKYCLNMEGLDLYDCVRHEIDIYKMMKFPKFMPQIYGYDNNTLVMEYIKERTMLDICLDINFDFDNNKNALDLKEKLSLIFQKFIQNKIIPNDVELDEVFIMNDGSLKLIDFAGYLVKSPDLPNINKMAKKFSENMVEDVIDKDIGLEVIFFCADINEIVF